MFGRAKRVRFVEAYAARRIRHVALLLDLRQATAICVAGTRVVGRVAAGHGAACALRERARCEPCGECRRRHRNDGGSGCVHDTAMKTARRNAHLVSSFFGLPRTMEIQPEQQGTYPHVPACCSFLTGWRCPATLPSLDQPRSTGTKICALSRWISSARLLPACAPACFSCSTFDTGRPFTARITSPGWMPALAAAPPAC